MERIQKFLPTSEQVRHDAILTNISIAYQNPSYVADQVFPLVPVNQQAGIVPKYDQSYWFRDSAQLRAPGTASRRGGFKIDKADKYYAPRYSWGFELPDEVRDTAAVDGAFNLDADATRFVTEKGFLRREVSFATDFFKTGVWAVDKTGGTDFQQWSDYATSSPATDIAGWMDDMEASIGREANTLLLGKQVWVQLRWHPDLIDSIKYTQRGVMSTDLFGAMVDIPRILVGRAIRTSSAEGVAEASSTYVRIFGKGALLAYVPGAPSLMTPASGYTFVWNRVANALQYIKRMRNDEQEIDIVEMNTYFDQKQTARGAGTFLASVVGP
jgi:hypothetical protein